MLKKPLHANKMVDHAEKLREQVLEKAAIVRPENIEDWDDCTLAGWIMTTTASRGCAYNSLIHEFDGERLLTCQEGQHIVDILKDQVGVFEESTVELESNIKSLSDRVNVSEATVQKLSTLNSVLSDNLNNNKCCDCTVRDNDGEANHKIHSPESEYVKIDDSYYASEVF